MVIQLLFSNDVKAPTENLLDFDTGYPSLLPKSKAVCRTASQAFFTRHQCQGPYMCRHVMVRWTHRLLAFLKNILAFIEKSDKCKNTLFSLLKRQYNCYWDTEILNCLEAKESLNVKVEKLQPDLICS